MKIKSVRAFPLALPYQRPVRTSFGYARIQNSVIVLVRTDDGTIGVGESSVPLPTSMGTTSGGFLDVINNYMAPALIGEDPFSIVKLHEMMDRQIYGNHTIENAKAGVDMALHDIVGKALRVPVVQLIGGFVRKKILPIVGCASIAAPSCMANDAKECVETLGCQVLKVKIGGGRILSVWPIRTDPDLDVERIRQMREAIGDNVTIVADVNQGYTPNMAIRTIEKLQQYAPIFVEQPVDQDDLEGLVRVVKSVDVPIIADECAYTPRMLSKVIQTGVIEYFNLKPQRAGGLYGAMTSVKMVEAAGMKCAIDCVMGTMIADLALTHVSAAVREDALLWSAGGFNSIYNLKDQIIKSGGVKHEKGCYVLPDQPGLGCELKDEMLEKAEQYYFPQIIDATGSWVL